MPKEAAKRVSKKGKKDPNAPKRGLSAFMLFSQDKRASVKEENPDATFGTPFYSTFSPMSNQDNSVNSGQLGKLLGEAWKNLSEKEKAV
jgi:hypothetical protein